MAFTGFTNEFANSPISPSQASLLKLNLGTVDAAAVQLYWSFNAPYQPYIFSQTMEVQTNSSTANALYLPDATLATVGQTATIINLSATAFGLYNFNGTLLGTIATAGTNPYVNTYYLTLTDNTTSAGVWYLSAFGAGASGPTATTLVDSGTESTTGTPKHLYGGLAAVTDSGTAPGTYLKTNMYPVIYSTASNYTQSMGDRGSLLIWTAGTFNYILISAVTAGKGFIFSINNKTPLIGGSEITFIPNGADTIDITTMGPSTSASFISDGISSWTSLGYGLNTTPSSFTNISASFANSAITAPSLSFFGSSTGLGLRYNTSADSAQIVQSYLGVGKILAEFQADSSFPNGVAVIATNSAFSPTTVTINPSSSVVLVSNNAFTTNTVVLNPVTSTTINVNSVFTPTTVVLNPSTSVTLAVNSVFAADLVTINPTTSTTLATNSIFTATTDTLNPSSALNITTPTTTITSSTAVNFVTPLLQQNSVSIWSLTRAYA